MAIVKCDFIRDKIKFHFRNFVRQVRVKIDIILYLLIFFEKFL